MLRTALRCAVELTIKSVSCPGVWLHSGQGDVYVIIYVYGNRFVTWWRLSIFPVHFYETFLFSKVYRKCRTLEDLIYALKDDYIIIKFVQGSKWTIPVTLGTYESNLRSFLFPSRNFAACDSNSERELLFRPTRHFPFQGSNSRRTPTSNRKWSCAAAPYVMATPPAIMQERGRRPSRFTGTGAAYSKNLKETNIEDRPLFVVRKVDDSLLSRMPSLYKDYATKKVYCCSSPHRSNKCAACRMRSASPPLHHYRHSSYPGGKSYCKYCRHASPHLENQCSACQLAASEEPKGTSRGESPPRKPNESPLRKPNEVFRRPDHQESPPTKAQERRLSPASVPSSPTKRNVEQLDDVDDWRGRSPWFSKPTFQERFGDVPVFHVTDATASKPTKVKSSRDQALQTEYMNIGSGSKFYESPYACSPYSCLHWKNSGCPHDQCHTCSCSCPYCPSYWRSRLDGCAHHHHGYWQAFRGELANLYDDLYRHTTTI